MIRKIRRRNCVVKTKKKKTLKQRLLLEIKRNWILYLMILPVIVYFVIFRYYPMYGVTLAFKEYKIKLGIMDSPWVGFKHFNRFFSSYNFESLLKNTLVLSFYSLVVGFPIPITFALLLNYVRNAKLKKAVQMVSYAPHFLSTVVICAMISIFTTPDTGAFNLILKAFGFESVNFMGKPELFKHIYVWSGIWQEMGFSAIIYISALAGVDKEMHDAAIVDGATIVQRILHIDLPTIKPTIAMLLILRFGSIMNIGFEKVYLLQNPLNSTASSIISTYVYEVGLVDSNYGYSTAVGLFNTIINVILLITANMFSKKALDESLF